MAKKQMSTRQAKRKRAVSTTDVAETKEDGVATADKVDMTDRRIVISGTINENTAALTINTLLKLEQQNPTEPILLVVDSYGGYVDSMFAIVDTMDLVRCDVITLCVGKAMSAGAAILLSGAKGKRMITPRARVMLHQISSFHFGKVTDLDNDMKETKRLQEEMFALIESRTKLRGKKLKDLLAKDYYLTAKESVRNGVVDKIITRFPTKGILST